MTTKYPGADTSAERLAEINRLWQEHKSGQKMSADLVEKYSSRIAFEAVIRDLLAMMEEREDFRLSYEELKTKITDLEERLDAAGERLMGEDI